MGGGSSKRELVTPSPRSHAELHSVPNPIAGGAASADISGGSKPVGRARRATTWAQRGALPSPAPAQFTALSTEHTAFRMTSPAANSPLSIAPKAREGQ
eukprot:3313316-Pyramimonas_sp.AAC.1